MAVIADGCLTSIRLFGVVQGVCLGLLLSAVVAGVGATPAVCTVGQELEPLKSFDLPDRPTQGPICGEGSCCSSEENVLSLVSKKEIDKFIKESVAHVVSLFDTRSKRLEELFKEMMQRSKTDLHKMFERTYGILYLQNSDVFTDFFAELEKYYLHGGIKLSETMDHFFSILYQRMFQVINAQYEFNDDYLACVVKDMVKLKPFGDIPMKLGHMLKRSFAATRIFHKALGKGAVLAEKTLKLNVSDDCGQEIVRMKYCNHCTNQKAAPCNPYCTDTLKSCLQNFIQMNEHWDNYIDALDKVADKLLGPFNIEMVVEPINVKISEAIMNFQDSGAEVSEKVFVECGQPSLREQKTKRAADPAAKDREITYQNLKFRNSKKKHKKTQDQDKLSPMDKRITEVKQKIKETRNFWSHLSYQFCNNISTASPTDDGNCWNGTAISGYSTPPIPTKSYQPTLLSEQQFTLKVLVTKLESAFQGNDEELDDDEEEEILTSGSGSGSSETDTDTDLEIETTTQTQRTTESVDVFNTTEDDDVKVMTATGAQLTKALAHYILPIVMVWFGGAVTDLL